MNTSTLPEQIPPFYTHPTALFNVKAHGYHTLPVHLCRSPLPGLQAFYGTHLSKETVIISLMCREANVSSYTQMLIDISSTPDLLTTLNELAWEVTNEEERSTQARSILHTALENAIPFNELCLITHGMNQASYHQAEEKRRDLL